MPNARIDMPMSMALPAILEFVRELDYYARHDRLIINMPDSLFMAPFAMLAIASKIRYLRDKNSRLAVIFDNWENHEYLKHMGFFNMCGYQHGKSVGEAWGSINYQPITEIKRSEFYEDLSDKYSELPDLIQRRVNSIAYVLSRNSDENSNMFDILSYSVREIFRNVFEHSESGSLFFCAQYWPKSNKVEFAVSDFGIGIRRGLSLNPNFRFSTDKSAVEYALLPSVSGRTHLPRTSETWFNSGYGLYMTSRLARNGGNFVIASGTDAIHFSRKTKNNYKTSFSGTAIRVNLNVDEIGRVEEKLRIYQKEGHEIATKIAGSGNRPPSAMSLLLRRDFQK